MCAGTMNDCCDDAACAVRLSRTDLADVTPAHAVFAERLEQLIQPGGRVLDAGCGPGKFLSFRFARVMGCRIFGVDLCDDLRRNPHLDIATQADLTRLPFADATFDVIACR